MTETDEAAPTCYRHTDRETYVRCTRCDRSICPDCMNVAAVGFQCPDCVREGNKSIRQARTVFGGRVAADAQVTKVLIAVNVIAFVAQLANSQITREYAMTPVFIAFDNDYYTLMTSAFLHSPSFLLHIVFNMYALLAFGSQVERLLGGARFLVLYLVAAFGGSVLSFWLTDPVRLTADGPVVNASLGASGAVFGLFGAFFVMARKLRADTSQILVLIGINLAIGFAAGGYIDNWGHIGGLLAGGAVALVYVGVPRGRNQAVLHYTGAAVITAVLVLATAVRAENLRQDPGILFRNDARPATTSVTGAPSR